MKQSEINALNILNNISADSTADILEKSMGHKYFKREGVPGHYKYYYTEADYKAGRSSTSEPEEKVQKNDRLEDVKKNISEYGVEDYDLLLGVLSRASESYSYKGETKADKSDKVKIIEIIQDRLRELKKEIDAKAQQEKAPSESKESGSGKKDGKGKDFKLKYLLGQTESKFKQINVGSIEKHLKDLSQDSRISDLEGRLAMDCLHLVYTSKEISSWFKDESVKDNHVLTLAKTALNNIIDVKQMIAEITN